MLPTIYLLRHGLTDANSNGIIAGAYESQLLPEGRTQAAQAGQFLKDKGIRKIFCSPMQRTRETLAKTGLTDIPVIIEERVREYHCGIYEGRPEVEMPVEYKSLAMTENPQRRRPEGESVADMCARLRQFIDSQLDNCDGPVLVVTHGGTVRSFLLEMFPQHRDALGVLSVPNASVWKIEAGGYANVFTPTA